MNLDWTKYLLGGLFYYFFGSNSSATPISLGVQFDALLLILIWNLPLAKTKALYIYGSLAFFRALSLRFMGAYAV